MLPFTQPADIVNASVQLIGGYDDQSPVTGSPPTFDGSPTGLAAGAVYYECVQAVARRWGYDFSRNIVTLALTENLSAPPYGFSYEYIYPTNGIQIRELLPPTITDQNNPTPLRWVVGNTSAPSSTAMGSIVYGSNPAATTPPPTNGDTIDFNGQTVTWVPGSPSGYELGIFATLGGTIGQAVDDLVDPPFSTNPDMDVATYAANGNFTAIVITYKTPGPLGNTYTLSVSGSGTASGATLMGGANSQQRVIWTSLASAEATITNQPPESTWDPEFTEGVVAYLASKLATALDGKPETAQIDMEMSQESQAMAKMRTDS